MWCVSWEERGRVLVVCLFGVTSNCQTRSTSCCADAKCQSVAVEVVTVALRNSK